MTQQLTGGSVGFIGMGAMGRVLTAKSEDNEDDRRRVDKLHPMDRAFK